VTDGPPEIWIDERLRALSGPWRKVHYDFQLDAPVARVGDGFDAAQFVAALERAHVDSVTVFAKNTYGWCFFPSASGPVHPDLAEPDLLGKQVAACREAGIKVYAYLAYAWDEQLAERHPELLVWRRDRTTFMPPVGEQPMWSALCISHPELLERMLRHVDEVLDHCEPDGIWFDMVYPARGECYCWRCLDELRGASLDPLDVSVQRRHKHELHTKVVRALAEHVHTRRPDAQVDFNTQATLGLGDRLAYIDNIDIEALPTGGWGYWYFPIHARYARTFGVTVYGMSGRFHTAWGDYGGLKHPNQLRTEIAGIVAQGVRCDIGDQALPSARPDRATFETIAEAYGDVVRVQEYLEGAVPAVEAAIVVDGPPLSHLVALSPPPEIFPSAHAAGIGGMAKLLTECQLQYDVVDLDADLERYRLLVLPDSLAVDSALAERLEAHLDRGGAVIAAYAAARAAGEERLWPRALQGTTVEPSPFQPAFTRAAGDLLADVPRYADYEFAIYGEADRWDVPAGDALAVHGRLSEATFQRWQQGWQSAPPVNRTGYATVVTARGLGAFAFPIATCYFEHGYWFYRELFARVLRRLLPRPLVRSSAPASAEVTVTHQAADGRRGPRWMVHVINYSPLRRAHGGVAGDGASIEYVEDPIPLRDVDVALAVDAPLVRAHEAHTGVELVLSRAGDRWCVTVPEVRLSGMVVFEEER
jgi:hypothetical protein